MTIVSAFLAAGCGYSQGFLRDAHSLNQHEYRQDVGTTRFVRTVDGSVSNGSILCIIPINNEPAYKTAMEALHASAALKPNEVLENIREDHTLMALLFFYCVQTLTLSADVIEVFPPGATVPSTTLTAVPPKQTAEPASSLVTKPIAAAAENSVPTTTCEAAFQQLGQEVKWLTWIYPKATPAASANRSSFLTACGQQTSAVQGCLKATYLRDHVEECKFAFIELGAEKRAKLFATFVEGVE